MMYIIPNEVLHLIRLTLLIIMLIIGCMIARYYILHATFKEYTMYKKVNFVILIVFILALYSGVAFMYLILESMSIPTIILCIYLILIVNV